METNDHVEKFLILRNDNSRSHINLINEVRCGAAGSTFMGSFGLP
jgi:hypothetical protein